MKHKENVNMNLCVKQSFSVIPIQQSTSIIQTWKLFSLILLSLDVEHNLRKN
jgi:hypothetical protein